MSLEALIKALRFNVAFCVSKAGQKMMDGLQKGLTPKYVWDKYAGIALVEAANANVYYFTFRNFMKAVDAISDQNIKDVLSKLCCLYGIQRIIDSPSSLYEGGYIKGEQLR